MNDEKETYEEGRFLYQQGLVETHSRNETANGRSCIISGGKTYRLKQQ